MDVRNLKGKTVLVTGAGSGIGRETALAFARRGADLVACDIDKQGLDATVADANALGKGRAQGHTVDVADAGQMEALAEAVHAEIPALDILMNNAGVAIGGGFLDTSLEDWDWILGINTKGVVYGCHFFVPKMVERGAGGHVVNVASAAGYVATAELAAYSTTKFSVVGLSEALRDELSPHGIAVTTVCPGIINTPITRAARMVGPDASPENRDAMIEAYEKRGYTPERVASNILKAMQKDRGVAPIAIEAWLMYYAKRLFPGGLGRLARFSRERARRRLGLDPPR
jgi:NAD(P)-dependent dehydrogenase (short-subunit alcohol dehydrogenase family)